MKKVAINYSWPATLSDFSTENEQELFTRGKLKVFYKGETADHRFFSDKFSEELIKSLPYTPVVSYYDEEKDDFVGHATEQQIFGMVDPCVAPSFEKDEDGKEWAVCDVVLYTDRPDKVGKIAAKIVGHPQSLELDPETAKYTINYDERRHFKNIEFTAGKFVGVSVLGNDQTPAFTGSAFFSCNKQFEEKMALLRDYCEKHGQEHGGAKMNLKEFMTLSWGDISSKVDEALTREYGNEAYTLIVDMFEDSAIVRFYSFIDGSSTLQRVHYSCGEDGTVVLGEVNEVHITYEDIVKPAKEETGVEQATQASVEETHDEPAEGSEVPQPEVQAELQSEAPAEDAKEPVDSSSETADAATGSADAVDAAQVTNAEVTTEEQKVSAENDEPQQEEENSSAASFAESERAELEALKREKKVGLVNSYKDSLTEQEFDSFMNRIDSFEDCDSLELELLKIYKKSSEEKTTSERAFAFAPVINNNPSKAQDSLDSFVKKYKGN